MATLDTIWANRGNVCYVATRAGLPVYVSLGHVTADAAFADAKSSQALTDDDRAADDWFIAEIVPNEHGDVVAFEAR